MEEIKEIILSHCQGIAYPEFDLEDLNVMVKEINDHYTKVQSQELTKAKGEVERLKGSIQNALNIDCLWIPKIVDREHKGEAEALHKMRDSFLELLKEVK